MPDLPLPDRMKHCCALCKAQMHGFCGVFNGVDGEITYRNRCYDCDERVFCGIEAPQQAPPNEGTSVTSEANAEVNTDQNQLAGFVEGIQDSAFNSRMHSISFGTLEAVPHIQHSKVIKELLSAVLGAFPNDELYRTVDNKITFVNSLKYPPSVSAFIFACFFAILDYCELMH